MAKTIYTVYQRGPWWEVWDAEGDWIETFDTEADAYAAIAFMEAQDHKHNGT